MSDIFQPRDKEPADRFRSKEADRLKDAPKRFYKLSEVVPTDAGFEIRLDGRPVRTPGRSLLVAPKLEIGQAIAREWDAQIERIDPTTMPATRLANTAIDGVAGEMQGVREDVVRYAGSDLLCYRAEEPTGLVEREREMWDPLLDWAAETFRANFILGQGIVPVRQPPEAIAAIGRAVEAIGDPFRLAGLHVMTALTGSAITALAVTLGHIKADEAWRIAHVEEDWNVQLWGSDDEAAARRAVREIDMMTAASFATA